MIRNRMDWSDGYDYVKTALHYFKVETEFDQQVSDELSAIVYESEDIDGRIFRDCNFNYDYLTEHVLTEADRVELDRLRKEQDI